MNARTKMDLFGGPALRSARGERFDVGVGDNADDQAAGAPLKEAAERGAAGDTGGVCVAELAVVASDDLRGRSWLKARASQGSLERGQTWMTPLGLAMGTKRRWPRARDEAEGQAEATTDRAEGGVIDMDEGEPQGLVISVTEPLQVITWEMAVASSAL